MKRAVIFLACIVSVASCVQSDLGQDRAVAVHANACDILTMRQVDPDYAGFDPEGQLVDQPRQAERDMIDQAVWRKLDLPDPTSEDVGERCKSALRHVREVWLSEKGDFARIMSETTSSYEREVNMCHYRRREAHLEKLYCRNVFRSYSEPGL